MNAWLWFMVAWYVFNALLTVSWVGRPRPAVTPTSAVVSVVMYAALTGVVLKGAGVL